VVGLSGPLPGGGGGCDGLKHRDLNAVADDAEFGIAVIVE
jgi:hypothetical protein